MQHVGGGVEGAADAVATEIAHHAVAVAFHIALNRPTDIAQRVARFHGGDATHQRFMGDIDQVAAFGAWRAGAIHPAGVAMPAIEDDGDIDVEDIAILQHAIARNAVTDDMVDRDAGGFRIAAIIQRCRHRTMGDDVVVANRVEILRRHARTDMGADHIQRFSRQAACRAHSGEILRLVKHDLAGFRTAFHEHNSADAWRRFPSVRRLKCACAPARASAQRAVLPFSRYGASNLKPRFANMALASGPARKSSSLCASGVSPAAVTAKG